MGLWKSTKNVASKIFDIRIDRWMSLSYVKDVSKKTSHLVKDLVIPKKATRRETFEEALKRLDISEADLIQRQKEFTRLVYLFLGLAFIIISYAVYMLITGHPIVGLITFCISLYTLSQAFYFHFWLFQMKNRKLGCTFKEWFHSKINTTAEHP